MPDKTPLNQTTFLILAGGRGQRMNGEDKGLIQWQGKPIVEHIIQHLDAPLEKIIISANRNIKTYERYSKNVICDAQDSATKNSQAGFLGPLAGILSAMHTCTTPYLLCVPCDSPHPPENLLNNLWQCLQLENKKSVVCHDGDRLQPLFCLISCQYKQLLTEFLQQGRRKVQDFFNLIDPAICDFSTQRNHFDNFNRPEDMN